MSNQSGRSPNESLTLVVLGMGAWGTVLAQLARRNHHRVWAWSRHNRIDIGTLLPEVDVVIVAIPIKGVADLIQQVQCRGLEAKTILVTATKGLDPATARTPSQLWQATFPQHPVVVLSGPNLSKEISQGLPAATVAASQNSAAATKVQSL